jgi:thiol:disulfide interchange protein DsbA
MKRTLLLIAGWLLAAVSSIAVAAEPQIGRDYNLIEPAQPSATPGKIEVVEFFSYGCPHCKDFNPLLNDWAAKLPKDVSFRRVPVTFGRPAWVRLAKIYYALEFTGGIAKYDDAVFRALHDERVNFASDEAVVQWAASKGMDQKKFADAMNSFSMAGQIQRAEKETAAYRVSGVPALAIDGRYMLNTADTYGQLLKTADAVIAKARNEKAKK